MLVVMAGLPGVGKSALARRLAHRLPGLCLNKDLIRAAVFAPDEIRYDKTQDDACFAAMLRAAEQILAYQRDCWLILDGRTFAQGSDLLLVMEMARRVSDQLHASPAIAVTRRPNGAWPRIDIIRRPTAPLSFISR